MAATRRGQRRCAAREERDRRWATRRHRAAGPGPRRPHRTCARFTNSSSPVEVDADLSRHVAAAPRGRRELAAQPGHGVDPDLRRRRARPRARPPSTQLRDTHPLAPALPVIRRLLVDDAFEAGVVVAVTAADGTLLWVEGDPVARPQGRGDELRRPARTGASAAPAPTRPAPRWPWTANCRSAGREHFSRIVQPWSCTAVPVHDPATGVLLGAIDLTGGAQVASPQTLALVRATAVAVENHLALLRLTGPGQTRGAPARLVGPRRGSPALDHHRRLRPSAGSHADRPARRHPGAAQPPSRGSQRRPPRDAARRQGPRRGDHPRRDVAAAPGDRRGVPRRPGRTGCWRRSTSDIGDVFAALQRGDVECALARYVGRAAAAVRVTCRRPAAHRAEHRLRAAVLSTGSIALLRRWLELPEGRDDRTAGRRCTTRIGRRRRPRPGPRASGRTGLRFG